MHTLWWQENNNNPLVSNSSLSILLSEVILQAREHNLTVPELDIKKLIKNESK